MALRKDTKWPVFEAVDDGWWRDVLLDPRTTVPEATRLEAEGPFAHYQLDRQPVLFHVTCECGRADVLDREDLIERFGPDINVLHLVRASMPCGQRNKLSNHCRAYVGR